jgi:hypothetical protein
MSQYDIMALLPSEHQPALVFPAWLAEYSMARTISVSRYLHPANRLDTRLGNETRQFRFFDLLLACAQP